MKLLTHLTTGNMLLCSKAFEESMKFYILPQCSLFSRLILPIVSIGFDSKNLIFEKKYHIIYLKQGS